MKNHFYCFLLLCSGLFYQSAKAQGSDSVNNTVTISYDYYHFDKQFPDDWHIGSVEYKRQIKKSAVLGRVNYAQRLGQAGWQWEGEAYPRLSKNVYAYMEAGYSANVPVFAKFRSGASLYVNLPQGWEVEGGMRQLYFDKTLWIATGGLSKYAGNWLFNIRSFVSTTSSSYDQSYFLSIRRYFGAQNHYAWLQVGTGISPDENQNVQFHTPGKLSSRRISAGAKYFAGQRGVLLLSLGYSRDEFAAGAYGNQVFGSAGLGIRF